MSTSTVPRNLPSPAMRAEHRNWAEVSKAALRSNLSYLRGQVPKTADICAVVKADAYGHGAGTCARVFATEAVRWLAVTSPEEGARLRLAGVERPRILVLAGFEPGDAGLLIEHRLTPAVWDPAQILWLAAALERRGPEAPVPFPVHLKIETGMGRLGITAAQEPAMLAALRHTPSLRVEAVFSHLAASESNDEFPNRRQHERFAAARQRLGLDCGAHLLNSEGALRYPAWSGSMVRTGMALYGYSPNPRHAPRLRPVLSWKTRIVSIKDVPAGQDIGYGSHFRAAAPMHIATLAVGYADGYRRQFWPGGYVLIAGRRAPLVGAISMDLTTVDVTAIAASGTGLELGQEAVLLGRSGDESLTAEDLARWAGTIPYEILCGLSARVHRTYQD